MILAIDSYGLIVVKYEYDAWGKCRIVVEDEAYLPIAHANPFRYRGYFYDTTNGLYYLQTRFYDPELCRFISPDSIDYVDPATIGGVNIYSYCNNNPVMYSDPSGHIAISSLLIGLAISIAATTLITHYFGPDIASAIGSVAGGATAIATAISLFAFGPWGIVAGIALAVIGLVTAGFGVNEITKGITGINYLQSWTGMSDDLYEGLYIGANVLATVGTIAANIGMTYASSRILNNIMKDPKLITKYNIYKFKTYARYSTEWKLVPSKNGKGMRALSIKNKGNIIRYGYGILNAEHYNGGYYWIVCNGYGKFRFPFS